MPVIRADAVCGWVVVALAGYTTAAVNTAETADQFTGRARKLVR